MRCFASWGATSGVRLTAGLLGHGRRITFTRFRIRRCPGRFRADNSPWLKEPLEALVDPRARIVSIIASIQSSKTTIGEIGLCYIIANLPGPALWLDQTDDDARDQAESRLGRIFDECPPVTALYPRDRHKLKTATKHFSQRDDALGARSPQQDEPAAALDPLADL